MVIADPAGAGKRGGRIAPLAVGDAARRRNMPPWSSMCRDAPGAAGGAVALQGFSEREVILLEDDDEFAVELCDYLGRHGFAAVQVRSVAALLRRLAEGRVEAVILDQFIATSDVILSLAEIRGAYAGGLVFLTGNEELADRVMGLEMGADDFISKLAPPREIVARLRSVIRRSSERLRARAEGARGDGWMIDRQRRQLLQPDGTAVHLTAHEFELLVVLQAHVGAVVSRDALSEAVLRRPYAASDRSVDNLVLRLRKQLAAHGAGDELIKSVRGAGYVFVVFPEPAGE
jgi:two-component system OmpR family response regulator